MISPLVEQFVADAASELKRKFDLAFKQKLVECLSILLPGFTADQLEAIAPRITIVSVEDKALKEVFLDADGETYGSGTYLFCFSDEIKTSFENGIFTTSIG